MIIKIDNNTYIDFDPATSVSKVIKLDELLEEKETLEKEIAEKSDCSDEALLSWAKKNYPDQETNRILQVHTVKLSEVNQLLAEINGN